MTELTYILSKLSSISPEFANNKGKSAILQCRIEQLLVYGSLMGYPVVDKYEYLGSTVTPKTMVDWAIMKDKMYSTNLNRESK